MIYHEYITDLEIQYFYCASHSDLCTLFSVMERVAQSPEAQGSLGSLSLFDLRSVDFGSLTAQQFESFISRQLSLGEASTGNPCVILVRDMVSFGMIRMYGALADYRGLRREDQMCVTTAMDDAIAWLELRTPRHDREQIADGVARAQRKARSSPTLLKGS